MTGVPDSIWDNLSGAEEDRWKRVAKFVNDGDLGLEGEYTVKYSFSMIFKRRKLITA